MYKTDNIDDHVVQELHGPEDGCEISPTACRVNGFPKVACNFKILVHTIHN